MFRVLIVESEQKLNTQYRSYLEKQGFEIVSAYSANEALECFEDHHIDIVLCSFNMPGISGIAVVESIRAIDAYRPIMMLSESNELKDKQRAFNAGVDDYMVSPIDLNELILRLGALLRRAHSASKQKIVIGNAELDSSSLTVVEGQETTVLPPKEFMVLFKLCASPDRVFSRRDIMDDVWGIRSESGERTVDVHVKRLRERFSDSNSFTIETVRGIGYKAIAKRQ